MRQDSDVELNQFWHEVWELAQLADEEPHPDDTPDMRKARKLAADYRDSWADAVAADGQENLDLILKMLPQVSETIKVLKRVSEHQASAFHLQSEATADRAIAERDRAEAELKREQSTTVRAAAELKREQSTIELVAALREATKSEKNAWDFAREQEKLRAESDRKRAEAQRQLAETVRQHMPLFEEITEQVIKPFIQGVAGSLGAQAGPMLRDHIQHQRLREDREKEFQRERAKARREHFERIATDPVYREAQQEIRLYETAWGNTSDATRFERYAARMEIDRRERVERRKSRDEERRLELAEEEKEMAQERKEQARQNYENRMAWAIDDAANKIQRTVGKTIEDTIGSKAIQGPQGLQGPQGPQGPKGPPGRRAIIDVGPTPQATHNLTEEIE